MSDPAAQERESVLMAAHDDLAALAQRLETRARTSGDKTHLGTAAGVRLAAFRLIELAEGAGGTGDGIPSLTRTAVRAFMSRVDNPSFLRTIEARALNGGWAGSRAAGAWDPKVSDAISKAAVAAVIDLFRAWAAEPDEPDVTG